MPDEGFEVLNLPTDNAGSELTAGQLGDIALVAEAIADVTAVAAMLRGGGALLGMVDGNDTVIRVKRQTNAEWVSENAILPAGVFGYATDTHYLKIGDGTTAWDALQTLGDSGLTIAAFEGYRDAAIAARDEAEGYRDAAQSARDEAADSAGLATGAAETSQLWAAGDEGAALPGGAVSSKVSAQRAAVTAQASRLLQRSGPVTADETYAAGYLNTRRRVTGASLVTVTIPAGIFASAGDLEAWGTYRKEGAGNVKFVAAAGGSDLAAPVLKGSGTKIKRIKTNVAGQSESYTARIAAPAITDGKLAIVPVMFLADGATFDALSATAAIVGTPNVNIPLTVRRAAVSPGDTYDANYAILDGDLDSFAGGDIDVTVTGGKNVHLLGFHWYAVDGHGGNMYTNQSPINAGATSSISVGFTGLGNQSLVCAAAHMRGPEGSATFASFSANVAQLEKGVTTDYPDTLTNNTQNFKNSAWARGAGVANSTADFNVSASFASAFAPATMAIFAYPPKSVVGGGDVVLKLTAGRDTLSVLNGEAQLFFHPDGKTVTIDIPDA